MGSQKPRIIPWLIDQINSQAYPGLKWSNREQTQFRIPWKHGLRQDCCENDVKIFEAWAIASGCYDPSKDERNPAVWKRNVRSALNRKNEISLVKDNSSDSKDPHKIYEILRGNTGGNAGGDAASEDSFVCDSLSPTTDISTWGSPGSQIPVDGSLAHGMTHMQISIDDEDLYRSAEDLQSSFGTHGQDWYNNMSPDAYLAGAVASPVYDNNLSYSVYKEQPGPVQAVPSETQDSVQQDLMIPYFPVPSETQDSVQQNLMNQFFPNNTFETQFDVKIYYRGHLVKTTLVRNSNGFHITSSTQPNPESYLEDVTLPPPTAIHDQKVAAEITKILGNLNVGTMVEVQDGSICAKRMGKCRSFWAMSDEPTTTQPSPISKTDYSVLYNCQTFVKELIEFIEKKRTESPQYSIWICLGEFWPDRKSWKSKFIMVQITPISMQMLHEMSYSIGASSLRSSEVNLQISDSLSLHSTSDLLTFLKEFEEKMECS